MDLKAPSPQDPPSDPKDENTITVDAAQFEELKQKLADLEGKSKEYETLRGHLARVSVQGEPDDETKAAYVQVLLASGLYSEAQAQQIAEQVYAPQQDPDPEGGDDPLDGLPPEPNGDDDGGPIMDNETVRRLQEELDLVKQQLVQVQRGDVGDKVTAMKKQINDRAFEQMKNSEFGRQLAESLTRRYDAEKAEQALRVLAEDAAQAANRQAYAHAKQRSQLPSEEDLNEILNGAVESISERQKAVIVDPTGLGASSETVSESDFDFLKGQEPVKPVDLRETKNPEERALQQEAHRLDALMRAASETPDPDAESVI